MIERKCDRCKLNLDKARSVSMGYNGDPLEEIEKALDSEEQRFLKVDLAECGHGIDLCPTCAEFLLDFVKGASLKHD